MAAIGIDLGTSNTVIGVYKNGKVEIIQDPLGQRLIPSLVCYSDRDGVKIGNEAKVIKHLNVENTIYGNLLSYFSNTLLLVHHILISIF